MIVRHVPDLPTVQYILMDLRNASSACLVISAICTMQYNNGCFVSARGAVAKRDICYGYSVHPPICLGSVKGRWPLPVHGRETRCQLSYLVDDCTFRRLLKAYVFD